MNKITLTFFIIGIILLFAPYVLASSGVYTGIQSSKVFELESFTPYGTSVNSQLIAQGDTVSTIAIIKVGTVLPQEVLLNIPDLEINVVLNLEGSYSPGTHELKYSNSLTIPETTPVGDYLITCTAFYNNKAIDSSEGYISVTNTPNTITGTLSVQDLTMTTGSPTFQISLPVYLTINPENTNPSVVQFQFFINGERYWATGEKFGTQIAGAFVLTVNTDKNYTLIVRALLVGNRGGYLLDEKTVNINLVKTIPISKTSTTANSIPFIQSQSQILSYIQIAGGIFLVIGAFRVVTVEPKRGKTV